MVKKIQPSIRVEEHDYAVLKKIAKAKGMMLGHYIGSLLSAEVRKNIDIIREK